MVTERTQRASRAKQQSEQERTRQAVDTVRGDNKVILNTPTTKRREYVQLRTGFLLMQSTSSPPTWSPPILLTSYFIARQRFKSLRRSRPDGFVQVCVSDVCLGRPAACRSGANRSRASPSRCPDDRSASPVLTTHRRLGPTTRRLRQRQSACRRPLRRHGSAAARTRCGRHADRPAPGSPESGGSCRTGSCRGRRRCGFRAFNVLVCSGCSRRRSAILVDATGAVLGVRRGRT